MATYSTSPTCSCSPGKPRLNPTRTTGTITEPASSLRRIPPISRSALVRYSDDTMRLTKTFVGYLLLCGCWAIPSPCDLVAQGIYRLEANDDAVTGVKVTATEARDGLVVTGRLKDKHHHGLPHPAVGSVALVAPDGTVLDSQPLTYSSQPVSASPPPSRFHRRSRPQTTFTARFPSLPPVGSTIRVTHQIAPHDPASREEGIR